MEKLMRERTEKESGVSEGSGEGLPRGPNEGHAVDIKSAAFNPKARELSLTWSSYAREIFCLNSYPNGITLSVHGNRLADSEGEAGEQCPVSPYGPAQFHLRLKDTKDYQLPAGKYFLYREDYAEKLEQKLSRLRKQGEMDSAVFYFGTTSDPFTPFYKKFDVTVTCLELLEHYRPGLVVVQTRSPMVIAALPMLRALGNRAVVAISIESHLESMIARYTPNQPRISERLIAAKGLRAQGARVNLVASPVLPYGEFYRDAWDFARILDEHADYITLGSLASGAQAEENQLKALPLAQKLVRDRQYRWLRPHSHRYLYYALSMTAPEKLLLPVKAPQKPGQLNLFAA